MQRVLAGAAGLLRPAAGAIDLVLVSGMLSPRRFALEVGPLRSTLRGLDWLLKAICGTLEGLDASVPTSVTPEPMSDAVSWMAAVGGQWDERLAALELQFR